MNLIRRSYIIGLAVMLLFVPIMRLKAQILPQAYLDSWYGFTTNWNSDLGYSPGSYSGVTSISLTNVSGFIIDTTNATPAFLQYPAVESDGHTNIDVNNGSIELWFRPNWSGTNQGGSGPGANADLLTIGQSPSDPTNGMWITVDSHGAEIFFYAHTNGVKTGYVDAPIAWSSNVFHYIVVTYSSTNSSLYIDAQLITNGLGITSVPSVSALTNGIFFGSDCNGFSQARGTLAGIRTWSVVIDGGTMSNTYSAFTASNSGASSGNDNYNPTSCTGSNIWTASLGPNVDSCSPAIGLDGTIYVIGTSGFDQALYAFDASGNQKWIAQGVYGEVPTIGDDGTIYLLDQSRLNSISTNGLTNWQTTFGFDTVEESIPILGQNKSIYFCGYTNLYSISTNGTTNWIFHYPFSDISLSAYQPFANTSPVVGLDNIIYIAAEALGTRLLAINPNGTLKWSTATNGPLYTNAYPQPRQPPTIDFDGTIYIETAGRDQLNAYIFAISTNGTIKWVYTNAVDANGVFCCSPIIGPGGTIFVTGAPSNAVPNSGTLYALDRINGKLRWEVPLPTSYAINGSSPAIAADGTLYYGGYDGVMYAIDSATGTNRWINNVGDSAINNSSPAIGRDGNVYIQGGSLYAFCGTASLACSAWPQYIKNPRHTGRTVKTPISTKSYTNGVFQFNVSGTNGIICDVCGSTNLVFWTNIGNIVLTNTGTNFVDTQASNYPHRFYHPIGE